MIKVEFRAMGCRMAAFLDCDSSRAVQALESVPAWFDEWERALSRFLPDSDLNRLNAAAGAPARVSPVVWEVLQVSLEIARWTGGLVVPTLLKPLQAAGYDRSFDLILTGSGESPLPQPVPPGDACSPGAWQEIIVERQSRSVYIPAGMGLDFGGTAKGWAAEQAASRLAAIAPALVDAGGDIAVSGLPASGMPWPVAIGDPLALRSNLGILELARCGVATSGIDYRRWQKDGAWKHHIIDPRTARPAETDLLSVTVVAPDAMQAEAAAKAVLILGSREGLTWLEDRPSLAGLLALQDGRTLPSSNFEQFLWSTDANQTRSFA